MRAYYLYDGNIKINHRHANFIFTFTMYCCKQTSDEDQIFERVKLSPLLEEAAKMVNMLAGSKMKI